MDLELKGEERIKSFIEDQRELLTLEKLAHAKRDIQELREHGDTLFVELVSTRAPQYGGTIVKRASARTIFDSGKCGNHSGLLTNLSQIWENKFFWWSRCCGRDTKEMAERR